MSLFFNNILVEEKEYNYLALFYYTLTIITASKTFYKAEDPFVHFTRLQ